MLSAALFNIRSILYPGRHNDKWNGNPHTIQGTWTNRPPSPLPANNNNKKNVGNWLGGLGHSLERTPTQFSFTFGRDGPTRMIPLLALPVHT